MLLNDMAALDARELTTPWARQAATPVPRALYESRADPGRSALRRHLLDGDGDGLALRRDRLDHLVRDGRPWPQLATPIAPGSQQPS